MIRNITRIGVLLLALLPAKTFAIDVTIYCGNLPGCGSGFENFLEDAVWLMLEILPTYFIWLTVVFVMIGGMLMVLNLGDESRYDMGKKTVIYALGGAAIGAFSRRLIDFVMPRSLTNNPITGEDYIDPSNPILGLPQDTILGILFAAQRIIFTLFEVALVIAIVYNAVRLIVSRGKEDEYGKAINGFFYSAVGAIVINLAHRLVEAVLLFIQ